MKKMIMLIAAIAMLVGYSVTANADSVNTSVPLSFTITPSFGFTLSKYSADFGSILQGGIGGTDFGIFCRSNHDVEWKLGLNANEFSNGVDTVPSDPNFKYGLWTNGATDPEAAKGTFNPTIGSTAVVPVTQATFYTCHADEQNDPIVALTMGVSVTVPTNQAAGLYDTILVLTMFE